MLISLVVLFLTGLLHIQVDGWRTGEHPDWGPGNHLGRNGVDHRHRHRHTKRSVPIEANEGRHSSQAYSLTLDPQSKFLLSWTPDYDHQQVHFRVEISQLAPQSWFALGFSERGEWPGSDLCVAWEDWKGTFLVQVIHYLNS